jgi:hypothetical protein
MNTNSLVLTQGGLTGQDSIQSFNGYEFAFRVEPYPVAGKTITQKEYRLILTVTKSTQSNLQISAAPIHDVKAVITLSQPHEVLVYLKGGLRDTCTTFNSLTTTRNGNDIIIAANVQTITGRFCGQVYGFFERCVVLGSDFVAGQTYNIKVNDWTTNFKMP